MRKYMWTDISRKGINVIYYQKIQYPILNDDYSIYSGTQWIVS